MIAKLMHTKHSNVQKLDVGSCKKEVTRVQHEKLSQLVCQKHILVLVCNEDDGKTLVHHVPIETSPGSIWFPNRLS